jgi:hypothetical protein
MLFTSNSSTVAGSGVGPAAIHVWGCRHLRSSMFYGLILSTMFIASLAAARPAKAATSPPSPFTGECANLPLDHAAIISKAVFPVSLTPYGNVCFVAHITKYPFPPDNTGLDYSTATYIALSLYQKGEKIYDFTYPNTPDWAWPALMVDIQSVAFRKLKGTKYTDVIVIGVENSANGPAVYLPLIFIASEHGFTFDQALAENYSVYGSTMTELLRAIAKVGVSPPAP